MILETGVLPKVMGWLGVLVAIGSALYPPIANTLIFILMALVLLLRPAGLFGLQEAQ